jgi:uncharacterized hydrophobic protein (TIGR00271 family)
MSTVLALLDASGLPTLAWAARLVRVSGGPLKILCVETDEAPRFRAVARADDDTPDLLRATLESLAEAGAGDATVYDCRGPRPRRAVLDALRTLEASRLVLHASVGEPSKSHPGLVRRIARAAPTDVLVIDPGALAGESPARVLVPQHDGAGSYALSTAPRLLDDAAGDIVAIADPNAPARAKRVFERERERAPAAVRPRFRQETPNESIQAGLRAVVQRGDLVLVDAEHAAHVPKTLAALAALRRDRADAPFAVGVTRSADAAGPGRLERAVERLRLHAPTLSRDERKDLYERLERGGRLSTDFAVMLTLSAAIAALGLIQSSAAVVIGAMLVAPLMTPLVAAGMSLVQGNAQLFRASVQAMWVGILGALTVSFLIGSTSPWSDLSAEVVARGSPNLYDLGIALLSGGAAAYALARPGLAGTLVGVAIAVALVPPLAAVGISLSRQEFGVATGAGVLFTTNLLAIILGAALVFRFFGVDGARGPKGAPRWVRTTLAMLAVGIVATTGPLVHNLSTQTRRGVSRPYARPLPPGLRAALLERVAREAGVDILMMAHSDIEHGFGVEVALLCDRDPHPGLRDELLALIRREMGDDIPARVLLLRAAGTTAVADAEPLTGGAPGAR